MRGRAFLLSAVCALILSQRLPGQDSSAAPHVLQWWEGAALVGGIAAASLFDQPLERDIQTHRSPTLDRIASDVRLMGQVEVFGSVPAAMAVAGLVTHRSRLTRGSLRVAGSLVLAGAIVTAGKLSFGRSRPSDGGDADDFKPFSGHDSFPSGHTTMAFALAASLANEVKRPWVTAGLLTVAAGTGWSRLNDNRHWLSDVLAGAAVGITSAELIDGRWRVFHLRPPTLLVGQAGVAIGWRVLL